MEGETFEANYGMKRNESDVAAPKIYSVHPILINTATAFHCTSAPLVSSLSKTRDLTGFKKVNAALFIGSLGSETVIFAVFTTIFFQVFYRV